MKRVFGLYKYSKTYRKYLSCAHKMCVSTNCRKNYLKNIKALEFRNYNKITEKKVSQLVINSKLFVCCLCLCFVVLKYVLV